MLRVRELRAGPLPVPVRGQVRIPKIVAAGTSTATPDDAQLRIQKLSAVSMSVSTPWPVFARLGTAWVSAIPYIKQDGEWVPL